jgi:hypothetical protein
MPRGAATRPSKTRSLGQSIAGREASGEIPSGQAAFGRRTHTNWPGMVQEATGGDTGLRRRRIVAVCGAAFAALVVLIAVFYVRA